MNTQQDLIKKLHFQNLLKFIKHHYCIEIKVTKANMVTAKIEIKWKLQGAKKIE